MELKEFIENKFDCRIDNDVDLKEFLSFMKVEYVTKFEMVKSIWGENIPKI